MLLRRSVEEDEEERRLIYQSSHMCPCCQEYITYTDEVFLVEISEAARDGNQIVSQALIGEDGDFVFEPYVLHFMCWEELLEQMREITQDQPPVEAEDGILTCHCCGSTIGNFEPFMRSYVAEVHVAKRAPNGENTDTIATFNTMYPICLPCVVHVFEDNFPDWEDLFSEFNLGTEEDEDES